MSSHGSSHANKAPYLRPEMWLTAPPNGLAFYLNSNMHDFEKYRAFHEKQIEAAARMNKTSPQNNSYHKVRAVPKKEKPVKPVEIIPESYTGETKRCRKCEQDLPIDHFAIVKGQTRYKKKDGTEKVYNTVTQRHVCKKCTWGAQRQKEGQQFVIAGIRIY